MLFSQHEIVTSDKVSYTKKCGACNKSCTKSKKYLQPYGEGRKGILIIGDYPTKTEEANQQALSGVTKKHINTILDDNNIDFDKDCRRINVFQCRPLQPLSNHSAEVDYCRGYIWKEIDTFKPKIIILLGDYALQSFLGHRWKKSLGDIRKWRGWVIPDVDVNAFVCATYSPAYLESIEKQSAIPTLFKQDIERVLNYLDKPRPEKVDYHKYIQVLDKSDAIKWINDLLNTNTEIAFDYETTGLKPHAEGHELYCCSIATDNECISFMVEDDEDIQKILQKLLTAEHVPKVAANMKFEYAWSTVILGVEVQGLVWDTMQMAHVLDNREGVTGLKFQAYAQFGVLDYDSHISEYLKSKGKSANALNNIKEAPQYEILLYCGLDSILEKKLANLQRKEYEKERVKYGLTEIQTSLRL